MNKKRMRHLYILILILNMVSCASPAKIVYFQDIEGNEVNETILNFEPTIQTGDLLLINVSAIDGEAAIPFNLYETPMIGNSVSSAKPLTYLVDADGAIQFPVIGKLIVKDSTTKELTEKLSAILETYIKDPIINIRITNFKVTVLGQVNSPGSYPVQNERISIIEAIGLAGDLEIHGKRKNVMLIREQQGKRVFVAIDLTNKALFNSPYYYLAQNDVIYVEPNKTQINASAVGPNIGIIFSSISLLLSVITIFFL